MNDLSILRNTLKFESRFTQVPNDWLRDNRIGFRAKGVLNYLLSHRSGWRTSLEHLADVGNDGKDAIRTAVKELEEAGYLIRRRLRNNGQLAGAEWELCDPFDLPDTDSPMLDNPMQENPMQENPTVKNTNSKNTKLQENQILLDEDFEQFWKAYPRHTSKGSAKVAFGKALSLIEAKELIQAAISYASDPNLPEPQFIPHASTWLNQERWSDGALPERKKNGSSSDNARSILDNTLKLMQDGNGTDERKEIGH